MPITTGHKPLVPKKTQFNMGFSGQRSVPAARTAFTPSDRAAPLQSKVASVGRARGSKSKSDAEVASTLAEQVKDVNVLRKFIVNLTAELMANGAGAAVRKAADASGMMDSMAAMNVLSDYESEDDSHLFSQQQ